MRQTVLLLAALLCGCSNLVPQAPAPSAGHIQEEAPAAARGAIPEVVEDVPFVPEPESTPKADTYSVVVNGVPVAEILFALARDANLNIDVHPDITGSVTLNAVDQTLDQILDRLSRQVDLRYEMNNGTLVIAPDTPYYRTYKVDFVNMARETTKTVTVATQIETGGAANIPGGQGGGQAGGQGGARGGNNNSTTRIESTSNNRFWLTLYNNVMSVLGQQAEQNADVSEMPFSTFVIPNPESGVITVLATRRQHEQVQGLLDEIIGSAQRQVLIEATIVEVELSDRYQAGIDWSRLASSAGFNIQQALLPGTDLNGSQQFFLLEYQDAETDSGSIGVTVRALDAFGNAQVLSSPKLMVLNNQTALLKVVENVVYFTVETNVVQTQTTAQSVIETEPHTVPVGFVMSVTPGIYDNNRVMLNVRPTISRISRFVNDPNPLLAEQNVISQIPVVETRELESLLRVGSGQIAVLGGLMQDDNRISTQGVPALSRLPGIGEWFNNRDNNFTKSELVVFLKPTIIKEPDIKGELAGFAPYLPRAGQMNPGP